MKTYKQRKQEYIQRNNPSRNTLEGMGVAEKLVETCIREDLKGVSELIRNLATLLDTKQGDKKEEIIEWLKSSNLSEAKSNLERLINICRL